MSASSHLNAEKSLNRVPGEPLGVYIEQYAARIAREGYSRQSSGYRIGLIEDFSRWLMRTQRDIRDVDEGVAADFLAQRARDRLPQNFARRAQSPRSHPPCRTRTNKFSLTSPHSLSGTAA